MTKRHHNYRQSACPQREFRRTRERDRRDRQDVRWQGRFIKRPKPRVAIIGAAGIGKTELSKAVAWWYVERGKVDAVLWASVSRDQGEFILRDLASLLSIVARGFVPLIVNLVLFWRL